MTFKENKVTQGTLVGRGTVADLIRDLQSIPADAYVEGSVDADVYTEKQVTGPDVVHNVLDWDFEVSWSER